MRKFIMILLLICVYFAGCSQNDQKDEKSKISSVSVSSLENQQLSPSIVSSDSNQNISPIITPYLNVNCEIIPMKDNLYEKREVQIISTSDHGNTGNNVDPNKRKYNSLEKRVLSGEMVLLDKNQSLFLNMDSEREEISYNISNLDNGEHSYSLQVNSCMIEGVFGYGSGDLYAVRLSGTKGLPTIQLMIESGGESFGYEYKFFCYDQNEEQESLQYIGSIKTSRNDLYSMNERSVSFWGWSDIFSNYIWEEEREYVLCKEENNNYYGIGKLPISCSIIGDILILNQDLYVYTTKNLDEYCGILKKGSKIMIVAYDGEQRIYIEDCLTTLSGWMKIVIKSNGETKIVSGDQEWSDVELFGESILDGDQ